MRPFSASSTMSTASLRSAGGIHLACERRGHLSRNAFPAAYRSAHGAWLTFRPGSGGGLRFGAAVVCSVNLASVMGVSAATVQGDNGPSVRRRRARDLNVPRWTLPAGGSLLHAAKAEMIGGGPDFAFAAGAHHITGAILARARIRAPAVDALLLARLCGIERALRPLRIANNDSGKPLASPPRGCGVGEVSTATWTTTAPRVAAWEAMCEYGLEQVVGAVSSGRGDHE